MFFLGVLPIVAAIIGFAVVVCLVAEIYPVATAIVGSVVGFFFMFGILKYVNWIIDKIF